MTRKALFLRLFQKPKFNVRHRHRCRLCGRSRAYYQKFGICRLCLRALALRGEIPGMRKASW
jgi:small subunit ribosomal protein S14